MKDKTREQELKEKLFAEIINSDTIQDEITESCLNSFKEGRLSALKDVEKIMIELPDDEYDWESILKKYKDDEEFFVIPKSKWREITKLEKKK